MNRVSIVAPDDQNVTFVELFFDLVFVFSVTQIVGILHEGITWGTVGRAVLIFWLVWWAWTQFTWALNAANTDHTHVQLQTLIATGVAFFMAVAVPGAFGSGALWFAIPYVLVRTIGLVVYLWVASDAAHRAAIGRFASLSVGGLVAVLAGAILGGDPQLWLWGVAVLLDVAAAALAGGEETWNLHPAHFVERHGLIVIIVLGESLIVAAAGLSAAPADSSLIAVGVLAVGLACGLWWSYFPYVRPTLERAMERIDRARQGPLARDVFSLAHFPMLCGIVAIAAAIEETILHPADPLPIEGRLALAAGLFLFLGGSSIAAWRAVGVLSIIRLGLAFGTGVGIVVLASLPPWASLSLAVGGTLTVVLAEGRSHLEST